MDTQNQASAPTTGEPVRYARTLLPGQSAQLHVLDVETGTSQLLLASADQLFERPRHPYTLGLLQSVPRLDAARKARLQPIEGQPRDMLSAPAACPFQPRCRYEVEQSRLDVPPQRGRQVPLLSTSRRPLRDG